MLRKVLTLVAAIGLALLVMFVIFKVRDTQDTLRRLERTVKKQRTTRLTVDDVLGNDRFDEALYAATSAEVSYLGRAVVDRLERMDAYLAQSLQASSNAPTTFAASPVHFSPGKTRIEEITETGGVAVQETSPTTTTEAVLSPGPRTQIPTPTSTTIQSRPAPRQNYIDLDDYYASSVCEPAHFDTAAMRRPVPARLDDKTPVAADMGDVGDMGDMGAGEETAETEPGIPWDGDDGSDGSYGSDDGGDGDDSDSNDDGDDDNGRRPVAFASAPSTSPVEATTVFRPVAQRATPVELDFDVFDVFDVVTPDASRMLLVVESEDDAEEDEVGGEANAAKEDKEDKDDNAGKADNGDNEN